MFIPSLPKILLVTFNWSTLTEIPYLLKQAECGVDVLCPADNMAIKNGYYDRWIDSGDSMECLIATLRNLVKDHSYRYILIGDDPILWAIYRQNITDLLHLLPIKSHLALRILNKVGFAEHCHAHSIPSPKFRSVSHRAEATEAIESLGFPLIVKENYSNGGNGVKIMADASSWEAFVEGWDFSEALLLQSFIEGRHVDVEALFKNGRLLQYVCSEVLEDDYGPSSKRRYFPNEPAIGAIIEQMGRSAVLHGFANMSLMQDLNTEKYYLFEADPRPNKWVAYGRWFGSDFSVSFKIFLEGGDEYDGRPPSVIDSPVSCWEVEHFSSHLAKLMNAGRHVDALLHLLDFDRNIRYTLYDPVLFNHKVDDMYRQVVAYRDSRETESVSANVVTRQPPSVLKESGQSVATIKIDNLEYDFNKLSSEAKAQLRNIQFVDQELARLQGQTAAMQTARNAYLSALKGALADMSEASKAP